jgi:hypothetical protein
LLEPRTHDERHDQSDRSQGGWPRFFEVLRLYGKVNFRRLSQSMIESLPMDERLFHLRSCAVHEGDSNALLRLDLELEVDGEWQPVSLAATSPPFRAFVCTALMCQHAYLRMNATERGLLLLEARGELWMKTAEWFVFDITAHFELTLRRGQASAEDLAFISTRMRDCPVSRNFSNATKDTTIGSG